MIKMSIRQLQCLQVNNKVQRYVGVLANVYIHQQLGQHTTVSKATGRHLDFGLLLTSITVTAEFYKYGKHQNG